jgi:nifR3 family TIM-barrel protein
MKNFWTDHKYPILALAPMEGITDSAFRRLCRESGADVVYTEFVSSDAIAHDAKKAFEKMSFDPSEQPVVCQIFGRDVAAFAKSAREIERRGFAGIDINFGCPAKKVVRHGSGVALLRDPKYARALVEAVADVINIPLSIKVRTSIRKERREIEPGCPDHYTALDLLDAIEGLPVSAIMVHGRSFESGFTGDIDVKMIRQIKAKFSGIVLANGGITTPERAKTVLEQTGADGLGIARGAQGQPWLFQQIRDYLKTGEFTPLNWVEIRSVILRHAELAETAKGQHGLIELRKHLAWYVRGYPGAAALRKALVQFKDRADLEQLLPNDLSHT